MNSELEIIDNLIERMKLENIFSIFEVPKKDLSDLYKIVFKLKQINEKFKENKIVFNVAPFIIELIDDGILKPFSTLEKLIPRIFDYLKENFEEFQLERAHREFIHDNGQYRECGQCHKNKPYAEFYKDSKGGLRNTCKKCFLDLSPILIFRKKLKIIDKIYEGRLKGQCEECDIDIKRLPALSFHHKDKKYKEVNWGDILYFNLNYVLKKLESERVTLLCENCHSIKQSVLFNNFKDLILNETLFNYNAKEIEKIISETIFSHPIYNYKEISPLKHLHLKAGILNWIKKRFIIEKLFGGKCIGCYEITVKNYLPAFEFHHRNNLIQKTFKWSKFSHLDLYSIIKILRKEECIALCSNCHRMITHFNFVKNIEEIFTDHLKDLLELVKSDYHQILENVNSFRYPDVKFEDLLKFKFGHKDIWKVHLILIHNLIQQNKINKFNILELQKLLNVSRGSANKYIRRLKSLDLVELISQYQPQYPACYKLTEKGLSNANQIKKEIF